MYGVSHIHSQITLFSKTGRPAPIKAVSPSKASSIEPRVNRRSLPHVAPTTARAVRPSETPTQITPSPDPPPTALPTSKTVDDENKEQPTRVLHTRFKCELTEDDMKDHVEHQDVLKKVSESRGAARKARKDARRLEHARRARDHGEALDRLTVLSEKIYDDVNDISERAKRCKMPHICLVGPQHMDRGMLTEWYNFCRTAAGVHMQHKDQPSRISGENKFLILVVNRRGEVLVFDQQWIQELFRTRRLYPLNALAVFDNSNKISDLRVLPDGHAVFVYDPKDDASCDMMLKWKCDNHHHVCPIGQSGQTESCVICRRNEIFTKYKLS